MENLFTVKQVAYILKVHPLTIRRYLREKKMIALKVGGTVRIKEEEFLKFQKEYTAKKIVTHKELQSEQKHSFSFDDPFWRLNGSGMSLAS